MKITSVSKPFLRRNEAGGDNHVTGDVRIVTSSGDSVMAHYSVLASASPVLESRLYWQRNPRSSERVIQILGVPCDAVVAFIGLLYSSKSTLTLKDTNELMEKYAVHLLLARKCDASRLYQKCMRLIAKDFNSVQQTEPWHFVQKHDLQLELEILQFLHETDQRKNRRRRERAEQKIYVQLNEAMECLNHICAEGCTQVGPLDAELISTHAKDCSISSATLQHAEGSYIVPLPENVTTVPPPLFHLRSPN